MRERESEGGACVCVLCQWKPTAEYMTFFPHIHARDVTDHMTSPPKQSLMDLCTVLPRLQKKIITTGLSDDRPRIEH